MCSCNRWYKRMQRLTFHIMSAENTIMPRFSPWKAAEQYESATGTGTRFRLLLPLIAGT